MSTALALVAAHAVADFPLQRDWMAAQKHDRQPVKVIHCAVHAVVTGFLLLPLVRPTTAVTVGTAVGVAHFAVDSLPRAEQKEGFKAYPFAVDQSLHLLTLFIIQVTIFT